MSELAICAEFIAFHKKDPKGLRLGQHFCNLYIKESFSELYYAHDDKAKRIIIQWLSKHQYTTELPQIIDRENKK